MAIRVGVRTESSDFTVVVENDRVGYRQVFETYRAKQGPYGVSMTAFAEARAKAVADAEDWVAKFKTAGIKAELTEFAS